jgi:phage terminase small subunit
MASKHSRCPTLTPKQQLFVREYLVDLNGKQAAIRAGYSPRVAEVQASENLRIPKVQSALAEAMAARAQRVEVTADAVLREIALLSHSNIEHYTIDNYGDVHVRPGAPPDAMKAVASLRKKILHTEQGTLYETEIRLWNKPTSVRMAAEHLGLLLPTQTSGPITVNVLVHYAPTAQQQEA